MKKSSITYISRYDAICTHTHIHTHARKIERGLGPYRHEYKLAATERRPQKKRDIAREINRERKREFKSRRKTSGNLFSVTCSFFDSAARSQFGVDKTDVRVMTILGRKLAW